MLSVAAGVLERTISRPSTALPHTDAAFWPHILVTDYKIKIVIKIYQQCFRVATHSGVDDPDTVEHMTVAVVEKDIVGACHTIDAFGFKWFVAAFPGIPHLYVAYTPFALHTEEKAVFVGDHRAIYCRVNFVGKSGNIQEPTTECRPMAAAHLQRIKQSLTCHFDKTKLVP